VAAASVIVTSLIAVPSIQYAGRPIGIGTAIVIRAVSRQLIGAIIIVVAGWYLQMTVLAGYPSPIRILLSGAFCTCLYLAMVVKLFRHTEPIKVARSVVRDLLRSG
jgi:PST family polysaccharide transporter